jgi:hypothetical protein
MTADAATEEWLDLEVVLADCLGPNLNHDAYTQESLQQLAEATTQRIVAHEDVPVAINFGGPAIGTVQECWFDADTHQLRARIRARATPVGDAFKLHPPMGALAVQTRYTTCSDCGKILLSALETPCPGAHHVIGAAALDATSVSYSLVAHSAFARPPGEPTVELPPVPIDADPNGD